ncbi:hypothetical protein [Bacillus sp. OAE603]|uniref:SunI/YnzG family protein n=1 Tax=Gottfriedia sp. OAE603 TaxID=2663872 RepID=UPI001789EEE8
MWITIGMSILIVGILFLFNYLFLKVNITETEIIIKYASDKQVIKKEEIVSIKIPKEYAPKAERTMGFPTRTSDRVLIQTKSTSYALYVQNDQRFISDCKDVLNVAHLIIE